jgi:hypothetical protein
MTSPTSADPDSGRAITLPGDFAQRVLREVDRRRTRSRRFRALGTSVALAAVLIVGTRVPHRLSRALSYHHPAPALAPAADDRDTGEDLLANDEDLDPGTFLLAGIAEAKPLPEPGEDSDENLLGRE